MENMIQALTDWFVFCLQNIKTKTRSSENVHTYEIKIRQNEFLFLKNKSNLLKIVESASIGEICVEK